MKFLLFACLLGCVSPVSAEPAVTIHLLDHTRKKETATKFWIDWSENWRGIVESREATPEQAEKIVALLQTMLLPSEALHFCGHDPIYGVVAKNADGKELKTSLCFSCLTWAKPKRRLNISGEFGVENELCLALREVIELPEELRKPQAAGGE